MFFATRAVRERLNPCSIWRTLLATRNSISGNVKMHSIDGRRVLTWNLASFKSETFVFIPMKFQRRVQPVKILFWSHYEKGEGISLEIKTDVWYNLVTLRRNVYIYLFILKAFSGSDIVYFDKCREPSLFAMESAIKTCIQRLPDSSNKISEG